MIGWDEIGDLSALSDRDALQELVTNTYPDESIGTTRVWTGELWAFRGSVQWVTTDLPRSDFDQDLLYSLGVYWPSFVCSGTMPRSALRHWCSEVRLRRSVPVRQLNLTARNKSTAGLT